MTRNNKAKNTVRASGLARLARFGIFAAAVALMSPAAALAKATAHGGPAEAAGLNVPTTKLLAIGSFTGKATPNLWKPILPAEMRQTALLYLDGKIDQWYVKQDQSGVVFVMNLSDPGKAHDLLDKLPLGKAGLMEFQIIPLGPLSPLRALLSDPQNSASAVR